MGLGSALILWVLAAGMSWQAIRHWHQPAANALIMAIAAGFSLVVNGALAWGFRDPHDLNRRSTLWHLATDSAGSFGVLAAAVILQATGFTPINAVLTIIIALLMAWGGWGVLRDAVRILLEAAPNTVSTADLAAALESVGGVERVHDLHVWAVGSDQPALACRRSTPCPRGAVPTARCPCRKRHRPLHHPN